ncbi:battenin-like [Oratosquilla oratoria]|uniref:battenin-like n=1 Tax=Oratosquilla oratoria TaxID=337810 RepID=UPI003F77028E
MSETATSFPSLLGGGDPNIRPSDPASSDPHQRQPGALSNHQHCPALPQTVALHSQPHHHHPDSRDDDEDDTSESLLQYDVLEDNTSSEPKNEDDVDSPSPDAFRSAKATICLPLRRKSDVKESATTDSCPPLLEDGNPSSEVRLLSGNNSHEALPSAVDPAAEKAREAAGEAATQKTCDPEKGADHKVPRRRRDLAAYWLLGFCNNFTYWVMITAAYDLLTLQPRQVVSTRTERHSGGSDLNLEGDLLSTNGSSSTSSSSLSSPSNSHNSFSCLRYSTGAILVADTLPATTLTIVAPLLQAIPTDVRVVLLGALCVAAYLTLGLANPDYVFLGVALASASRGLSDASFLGHASHFHKHVLSLWSSGTGVATFVGPLLYSALTTAGLPPRTALLSFLAVPSIIALSFWCLLSRATGSSSRGCWRRCTGDGPNPEGDTEDEVNLTEDPGAPAPDKLAAALKKKVFLYMRALGYVGPLTAFYLIMYFTNQGLLELVYFPASILTHSQQYAWVNTARCFGTLVSRSAHKFLLLPRMWMYVALAMAILVVVGCEAHYHFLPSVYVVVTLLLAQGILEGSAFRSSMFNIYNKTTPEERSFCLAVFPVSLFLPAVVAGLTAIPTQKFLCSIHRYA